MSCNRCGSRCVGRLCAACEQDEMCEEIGAEFERAQRLDDERERVWASADVYGKAWKFHLDANCVFAPRNVTRYERAELERREILPCTHCTMEETPQQRLNAAGRRYSASQEAER